MNREYKHGSVNLAGSSVSSAYLAMQRHRAVVERRGHVGVLQTMHLRIDAQRPLKEWASLGKFPLCHRQFETGVNSWPENMLCRAVRMRDGIPSAIGVLRANTLFAEHDVARTPNVSRDQPSFLPLRGDFSFTVGGYTIYIYEYIFVDKL